MAIALGAFTGGPDYTTLIASGSSKSGPTLTLTASASVEAGAAWVFVTIASDNSQTTNGASSQITDVSDSAGNTYSKAYEYTIGRGAAQGGATNAVWYGLARNAIVSGSTTITVTNANSNYARVARAFAVHGIGAEIAVAASGAAYGTAAAPASVSVPGALSSGLSIGQYLFLLSAAVEGSYTTTIGNPTTPSGFVWRACPGGSALIGTTGGSAATNMSLLSGKAAHLAVDYPAVYSVYPTSGSVAVTTNTLSLPAADMVVTLGAFYSFHTGAVLRRHLTHDRRRLATLLRS